MTTDEDALIQQMRAKRGLVKPTGKVYTGKSDLGDSDRCPVDPEHGKMYAMSTGKDWCPHSDHSSGHTAYSKARRSGVAVE